MAYENITENKINFNVTKSSINLNVNGVSLPLFVRGLKRKYAHVMSSHGNTTKSHRKHVPNFTKTK